jgi:hypothetical protein
MSISNLENSQVYELWRFHSGQMWSRVQTASVIEGGVITGWYALHCKTHGMGAIILFLGTFLLIVTSLLMRRDAQYMTACERKLKGAFPKPEKPLFGLSGRLLAVTILIMLALGNAVLAVHQLNVDIACA